MNRPTRGGMTRILSNPAGVAALWVTALSTTGALVAARYRGGIADKSIDLVRYFLPAGQRVAAGGSPYDVPGYVYSPLVAIFAAPMSSWENVLPAWAAINLACALVAVSLMTTALRVPGQTWQSPIIFGFSAATLLSTWPTTIVLALGQTDFMVMAALAFAAWGAARRRPIPTGIGIAMAALLKSWPVVSGLWLLRRGAPNRIRTLAWAVGSAIAGVAATAALFGPQSVVAWVASVADARSQPDLIHFSAWSFGEALFGSTQGVVPLTHDPTAALTSSLGFGLAVVALLLVALRWPGDPVLSLWHTTLACVLLLPVSHALYLLHGIPLIWVWAARVLNGGWRKPQILAVTGILLVWWLIAFRVTWGDMTTSMSTTGYAAVMLSSLTALGVSIVSEASRSTKPIRPSHGAS